MYKEHHMLWNKTPPNKVHCLQPDNWRKYLEIHYVFKNISSCSKIVCYICCRWYIRVNELQ